ncbi:MAG: GAF domain-containing protein [Caldimonas sp.]
MRADPIRLAELRRLMILDSSPERDFDNLTGVLASSLEVPIAMVNLLDERRDWFKSRVGLAQGESPAATSFCEAFFHSADDAIVVEDTTRDERFREHPLVIGAPHVRFYAAARLVVAGQTVGTLCAYDLKPRRIPADRLMQLQTLASAVVDLLRQRKTLLAASP